MVQGVYIISREDLGNYPATVSMKEKTRKVLLEKLGARDLTCQETIQGLWSGYGSIKRYGLDGSTVVVKEVNLKAVSSHPRGWNTDISHNRKLRSYDVEASWYETYSKKCTKHCRVPECYFTERDNESLTIVLEDIDRAGFPRRRSRASEQEIKACLSWLANFHKTFLGHKPIELWETGTYWHLDTRPDELEALSDESLKQAAGRIDEALKSCKFQTFVHGDAKIANFCFSEDGSSVAAVDFQYVGGGCGMKDVAYFIGSCLDEKECERQIPELLSFYFAELSSGLELEEEWRTMFPYAWADFHRFLKGWSPEHWKINSYSERITREVISRTNNIKN